MINDIVGTAAIVAAVFIAIDQVKHLRRDRVWERDFYSVHAQMARDRLANAQRTAARRG